MNKKRHFTRTALSGLLLSTTSSYALAVDCSPSGSSYILPSGQTCPGLNINSMSTNGTVLINGDVTKSGPLVFVYDSNAALSGLSITNNGTMQNTDLNNGQYGVFVMNGLRNATFINNRIITGNDRGFNIGEGPSGNLVTSFDLIKNNGTVTTNYTNGIIANSSVTSFVNTNAGTISNTSNSLAWGAMFVSSYIQDMNNAGTISGATNGLFLNGTLSGKTNTIDTFTNTGSITNGGAGYYGIKINAGSIGTLNNYQGALGSGGSALTYTGKLPTFYNIMINGSGYGQLTGTAVSAPANATTMTFGVKSDSTLQVQTYTSVMTGVSSSLVASGAARTGILGDYKWTLVETNPGVSQTWNLQVIYNSTNITGAGIIYLSSKLGTTVNPIFEAGTLQINQDNATYSQNFTVDTAATNTIDQNGYTSTFSGNFTNTVPGQGGNLIISNSGNGGKVIFTGNNTYSGTTTVSSGAVVAVNGSMGSSFNVSSGGTLQGTGSFGNNTIGSTINSGGYLAPGNSIGTITSNGALTFASGSTYQVEINSAKQSDKTVVNGAATIQGGTVAVSGTTPSPSALPATKYTILTATNGVSGKFSNLTGLASYSFLTPTLYYSSNDVVLGWDLTPFSIVAKTINQRNVGNALTVAALGPVNSLGAPIMNALFSGDYQNALAVMDTVSGSGLAGVQSTAMQVGEMASSSVSDQIAFWRSGETMDATGRTSQEGNNPRSFLAYAPVQRNVPAKGPIALKGPAGSLTAAVAPRTYRAWGSMFGGGANYLSDAGRGAAASNIGYYGGLIGVDYQVQPNILLGVALGGSSSNFNVGSLSTNGNLTGFHAGVYGAYTMGNSYVALNETFSAYSNQTSRKAGGYALMPYEQLSASFGSTEFRTRAELGHGVLMGGLKATPFVAAEIAAYQSNAFSEQSSIYASTFALKNNGQGVNSLPTFAGLRLSNAVTLSNGWRLAPVGSVAYVHEFFPQRQFNNILMSMPGADFNVAGPRSTYNLVQTKVGAQLNLNEKLALFTDFQGEFSPMSQSYGGKGGVKYVW